MGSQTKIEQYKAATTKVVTAPSGTQFTVRGITPLETLASMDGLPSLVFKDPKNPTPEEIKEKLAYGNEANKKAILLAVAEVGDGDDQLPYDLLTAGDINFLMDAISEASGMKSEEAKLARRVL